VCRLYSRYHSTQEEEAAEAEVVVLLEVGTVDTVEVDAINLQQHVQQAAASDAIHLRCCSDQYCCKVVALDMIVAENRHGLIVLTNSPRRPLLLCVFTSRDAMTRVYSVALFSQLRGARCLVQT